MSQNNDNSSGSDNVDLNRLLKMAKSIADDNMRKKNANSSLIDVDHDHDLKQVKNVNPDNSIKIENHSSPDKSGSPDQVSGIKKIIQFDPVYALIYGYKFPKTTVYFTIICIIIAIIIFYTTGPKKQVKSEKPKE